MHFSETPTILLTAKLSCLVSVLHGHNQGNPFAVLQRGHRGGPDQVVYDALENGWQD